MAHDAGHDLNQFQLQAGQRPVGHRLGQFDAAQERGQIVGQCVQLQPQLVVAEPLARQPCPAEGIFAFLVVLLDCATSIVKLHHPIPFHGQVCGDEALAGEQFAWVPFDLVDDPTRLVPPPPLILKVLLEPLHVGLRWSSNGAGQLMRDLLAKNGVGWQTYGVEIARLFQQRVEFSCRVSAIGPEVPHDVALGILCNNGIKDLLPAIGTVYVAVAQGAAFQHAEMIEQEVRVKAAAIERPVPGGPFLIAWVGQTELSIWCMKTCLACRRRGTRQMLTRC